MNTEKNSYIFIYSTIMVLVIAAALTVVALQLKPAQENNIRIEKMQNILQSVKIPSTPKDAETIYKEKITETFVINTQGNIVEGKNAFDINLADELKKENDAERLFPVFVCSPNKNDTVKYFIVQLRGKGLWGPIWGYMSFNADLNTVYGCMFDHKGETPGLGAEINTAVFQSQFVGKKIFDENNKFVSIATVKGGTKDDDPHGVDAISGGTITSKGLEAMIYDCLKAYELYLTNNKK
ncbi:MAG: NADH:ubiquinone reductase (Na(+)-transporting) subunit C [Bacteroidetes bacterium GWA2_31_9]|nr:MAG: NADH:ubiquinone reductase (Na(+)-transporting) subunit C [Bacteroidetes bacterium GWA2_31_9]